MLANGGEAMNDDESAGSAAVILMKKKVKFDCLDCLLLRVARPGRKSKNTASPIGRSGRGADIAFWGVRKAAHIARAGAWIGR